MRVQTKVKVGERKETAEKVVLGAIQEILKIYSSRNNSFKEYKHSYRIKSYLKLKMDERS